MKSLKKFGLNSLTYSEVLVLLIFIKFTRDLKKSVTSYIGVDENQVKMVQ
jgi:hypothetical protein